MIDRIQPGIFYRKAESAPDFFRLVTFNFIGGTTAQQAVDTLKTLWDVLGDLQEGRVRDLSATRPGDPDIMVDSGSLVPTLCLGTRLFRPGMHPDGFVGQRPSDVPELGAAPFNALKWGPTARPKAAQTDFAIALHGTTELSVARAVVELQKAIWDHKLPASMVCFFSGLHRDDRRSWIDFHDGINNMESGGERLQALEVVHDAADWLVGGSTMLFLKIEIDLFGWRKLPRELQEALVGRDKLSGCPLDEVKIDGVGKLTPKPIAGCPVGVTLPSSGPYVTVPAMAHDDIVITSHIHRTNPTRGGPDQPLHNRIFRQGYEFVDSPPDGGVRVGLNFVSFQKAFDRVQEILSTDDWLRDANFGGIPGDTNVPAFELMSIVAGGYFYVPPVTEPFPGIEAFRI
jgi:Dyp-type peroxidase family